jgi:hypothetical protein
MVECDRVKQTGSPVGSAGIERVSLVALIAGRAMQHLSILDADWLLQGRRYRRRLGRRHRQRHLQLILLLLPQ